MRRERAEVVRFGVRLLSAALTTGAGGNLSVLRRDTGLVAVTPSGVEYPAMKPGDVVVVDLDGRVQEGRLQPTSELAFHLALYRARADVNAVVHTHSPWATTVACLGWELPAVHYLVGFSGKKVPLALYATFGTSTLARSAAEALGDFNAVLLANHGLIAVGPDLARAFAVAEEIELVARIYLQAKAVGEPVILSDDEMDRVVARFRTYGQPATNGAGQDSRGARPRRRQGGRG
jgi:L-fuculose-phosphate aldolase